MSSAIRANWSCVAVTTARTRSVVTSDANGIRRYTDALPVTVARVTHSEPSQVCTGVGVLVFRQLPATSAVASVESETVLHVDADAADWRLDALSDAERARLTVTAPSRPADDAPLDALGREITAVLAVDARVPASVLARSLGYAESTVRRHLTALFARGHLHTQVMVDRRRLGFGVDADLRMKVPASRLHETGTRLAAHPAVHGAVATTGLGNVSVAVWLEDLDHLYAFITRDLADLDVEDVDTVLIGRELRRVAAPLAQANATGTP